MAVLCTWTEDSRKEKARECARKVSTSKTKVQRSEMKSTPELNIYDKKWLSQRQDYSEHVNLPSEDEAFQEKTWWGEMLHIVLPYKVLQPNKENNPNFFIFIFNHEVKGLIVFYLLLHFKVTNRNILTSFVSLLSTALFCGIENWIGDKKKGEKKYSSLDTRFLMNPGSSSNISHLLMQQNLLRSSHICRGSSC